MKLDDIIYVVKKLIKKYIEHDIGQIGGQLAYFSMLSLFPFIVYMNKLITVLNFSTVEIVNFLSPLFPDNIVAFITNYIEYISGINTDGILSIGLITLIYSASRIIRAVEKSINLAYEVTEKRMFIKSIGLSMLFIICIGIVVILMAATTFISHSLLAKLIGILNLPLDFLQTLIFLKWTVFAVSVFFAMSAIYYYMPNKKVSYKSVLPGTIVSVTGFGLLSLGFSIYVKYGIRYSMLYGSIGAIFLLLLWMYAAGIIIVMGAELNNILENKE